MRIIKRKGNIEEFNLEKIKHSLESASADLKEPFSESDLNVITRKVEDKLKEMKRDVTSSYEVLAILLFTLKEMGFDKIGKSYCNESLHFS